MEQGGGGPGWAKASAAGQAWVATRVVALRRTRSREADDEICRHCQQRQEDHDLMSEAAPQAVAPPLMHAGEHRSSLLLLLMRPLREATTVDYVDI
ncbi:hypothetical protein HaLaN_02908 [Haematococcus lacustris]|uniref:Uncharacterized protein n=1 Tax=Haematococcus lacustris TaxID=44745 RepID=A0A699YDA7_HAELA|nr:hypothetical protein HaLaN_02908 [Haematococcus lacustris]